MLSWEAKESWGGGSGAGHLFLSLACLSGSSAFSAQGGCPSHCPPLQASQSCWPGCALSKQTQESAHLTRPGDLNHTGPVEVLSEAPMGSQPHPNPEFLHNRLSTPKIRSILVAILGHGNEAIYTLFHLPVVLSPLREAMRSSRPISAMT